MVLISSWERSASCHGAGRGGSGLWQRQQQETERLFEHGRCQTEDRRRTDCRVRERMASGGAESSGNGEKRQRRMRQRSGWFGWNAWPAGEIRRDRVREERVER